MKTKAEVRHTPTPWDYDGEYVFGREENGLISKTVIQVCNMSDSENWEENAKLIVRAVNSHDELLRLLKAMTDQIDKHFYKLPEDNENDGKYWKRLYDSACELITQAEGK